MNVSSAGNYGGRGKIRNKDSDITIKKSKPAERQRIYSKTIVIGTLIVIKCLKFEKLN